MLSTEMPRLASPGFIRCHVRAPSVERKICPVAVPRYKRFESSGEATRHAHRRPTAGNFHCRISFAASPDGPSENARPRSATINEDKEGRA